MEGLSSHGTLQPGVKRPLRFERGAIFRRRMKEENRYVHWLTSEQRSALMARIGRRDTAPEMVVRSMAHRLGLRFRLCVKDMPGSPDLVFPRHKVVIFVHGCFWHHHSCPRGTVPKTRTEFWLAKFEANQKRDRANRARLRQLGWTVVEIWECETRQLGALERKLRRTFNF